MTEEAVGLLYRALYVYTIGFQDKAKKLVGPLEHKHVPLNNIWRAYLAVAETAMKVGFKVSKTPHLLRFLPGSGNDPAVYLERGTAAHLLLSIPTPHRDIVDMSFHMSFY